MKYFLIVNVMFKLLESKQHDGIKSEQEFNGDFN